MAKIKRKLLDWGSTDDHIGTNLLLSTGGRRLIGSVGQVFDGNKTLDTPCTTPVFPVVSSDVVSKKALIENTRCAANVVVETLELTAEDIGRGYAELAYALQEGQEKSLIVLYLQGAGALAQGQDFEVERIEGKNSRFKWHGWPLGRPGRLVVGDKIEVTYNACRPSFAGEFSPERAFLVSNENLEPEEIDYAFTIPGLSRPMLQVTERNSGKSLRLYRLSDGGTVDVTLPVIEPHVTMGITSACGKLILFTTPHPLTTPYSRLAYPFAVGKYVVYAYDGIGWEQVIEEPVPEEFAGLEDYEMTLWYGGGPRFDVVPLGEDKIGLYATWNADRTDGKKALPSVAKVRVYDEHFVYAGTQTLKMRERGYYATYNQRCSFRNGKLCATGSGVNRGGTLVGTVQGPMNSSVSSDKSLPFGPGQAIMAEVMGDDSFTPERYALNLSEVYTENSGSDALCRLRSQTFYPDAAFRWMDDGEISTDRLYGAGRFWLYDRVFEEESARKRLLGVFDLEKNAFSNLRRSGLAVDLINAAVHKGASLIFGVLGNL